MHSGGPYQPDPCSCVLRGNPKLELQRNIGGWGYDETHPGLRQIPDRAVNWLLGGLTRNVPLQMSEMART